MSARIGVDVQHRPEQQNCSSCKAECVAMEKLMLVPMCGCHRRLRGSDHPGPCDICCWEGTTSSRAGNEEMSNNCHPEPLWAKDLPECVERICTFAAFRPKNAHSSERARPAATKSVISREILRQKRLRMTVSQVLPLPTADVIGAN